MTTMVAKNKMDRLTIVPSPYQAAVFDFVANGSGNGVIDAVAGSGKTTTIVQAARLIDVPALFVAFNTRIVKELNLKLVGTSTTAQTTYSLGFSMLREAFGSFRDVGSYESKNKYRKLCEDVVKFGGIANSYTTKEQANTLTNNLIDLVRYARLTLVDASDLDAIEEMADHYNVEIDGGERMERKLYAAVAGILEKGAKIARDHKVIDFEDMIYLPCRFNLEPRNKFGFLFFDECQDASKAQLEIVLKCLKEGGRIISVGDKFQAIFGFAGADNESFLRIVERTNATVFPLSICYRCPTSVVAAAQKIVPHIRARDGAPAGIVADIDEPTMVGMLEAGDMILCRLTAPLIQTCIKLIEAGIPAYVEGRDIHAQVAALATKVGEMPGFTMAKFEESLELYQTFETEVLKRRKGAESKIQKFDNRCNALRACYRAFEDSPTIEVLKDKIADLFRDKDQCRILSSIHRAKGLEKRRIFIICPDKMPLRWANQQSWEAEQERNIEYVALTRATEALYFIRATTDAAETVAA